MKGAATDWFNISVSYERRWCPGVAIASKAKSQESGQFAERQNGELKGLFIASSTTAFKTMALSHTLHTRCENFSWTFPKDSRQGMTETLDDHGHDFMIRGKEK